jgi:hypothetical protein
LASGWISAFLISERTVARYLRRIQRRGDPAKKWLAFLHNHREAIVALDLFTVPTVTFRLLYCFFVIEHECRKILHCNVTQFPTAEWVVQQLREAFPESCGYQYAILDRDRKFDAEVVAFLTASGLKAKRTSVRAPWEWMIPLPYAPGGIFSAREAKNTPRSGAALTFRLMTIGAWKRRAGRYETPHASIGRPGCALLIMVARK